MIKKEILNAVFRKTVGILKTMDSSRREKLSMLQQTGFSLVLTLAIPISQVRLENTTYIMK